MKYIILSLFFILYLNVFSADYTVINTSDSGPGSLREAVTSANSAVGADNIFFNIPQSDPNYNSTTGTWTITLLSTLPYISGGNTNIDATTQTVNQGNTNPLGPEIHLTCSSPLDYSFILIMSGNTIKGFIITGFTNGILLYNATSTNNTITENYIGTNHSGTAAMPNNHGISVAGNANNNTISNNLISGNSISGIGINDATNTHIKGNKIGTDISGMLPLPNQFGIVIQDASLNNVGGNDTNFRNLISGNLFAGIVIDGANSLYNKIQGNYIGTDISGMDSVSNDQGIILSYAKNTTIGGNTPAQRNIISGNRNGGIVLNGIGTNENVISGNYIGSDKTGLAPLFNYAGIVLKSKANKNTIGGLTPEERNIISGNIEMGVYIEASDSNRIIGNYIGPDVTGTNAFYYGDTLLQANGLELNTVSKYNMVGGYLPEERNIISGNRVYGMVYYGNASENPLIGNYIGTDATGNYPLPNATGICVDGGSDHNYIRNNLLSGNLSYGIFIVTTGTDYTIFTGNLVGTNANGTDTIPNDSGLLLAGGTKFNTIGGNTPADRNLFSGNRYAGIQIADIGTNQNLIKGNFIGTDISGMYALPNTYGIGFTTNPENNTVDNNLISGNHDFGLALYENAHDNIITNNIIGPSSDLQQALGNGKAGIILWGGANGNKIGTTGNGNIIAFHDTAGILLWDNSTLYNTISSNSIYQNTFLGIDIFPPWLNTNDLGDIDDGPNGLMNFPLIEHAAFMPQYNSFWTYGTIDTQQPEGTIIEVFLADPNFVNYGDGKTYLGSTTADSLGIWKFFGIGAIEGDVITATATHPNGNTSEFSLNKTLTLSLEEIIPEEISCFPNPTNNKIFIRFNDNSNYIVSLQDLSGKLIFTSSGQNAMEINFPQNSSKGMYILKCISEDGKKASATKILFID
ncbi:MAG: NosD domain-containing protein [Bacteroidales bacterium]|nr:NosD domain-containing protein [Bacteroidales bacterium]